MLTQEPINKALLLSTENGMLLDGEHRAILISTQAFGALQKDLIENLGLERTKSFLFRHGWSLGEQDAAVAMMQNATLDEQLKEGPILHSQKGLCLARLKKLRMHGVPPNVQSFYMEGTWENSYEAIEFVRSFGASDEVNCYTLTGYASGYISRILGQTVIFKEQKCIAAGEERCEWIGKLAAEWGADAEQQLHYCSELPILRELEVAHERLLKEKEQLAHVTAVHKLLTEEIINGNGLESIARVMHDQTGFPILVENNHHEWFAYEGTDEESLKVLQQELLEYASVYDRKEKICFTETTLIQTPTANRLISPINLHGEIIGYCSFFFEKGAEGLTDINRMFIERMCSVCALSLLNEKVRHDSEERMKSRFLDKILNGRYDNKKDILKRSAPIRLDLSSTYSIITVDYTAAKGNYEEELALYENILAKMSEFFKEEDKKALVGDRSSRFVILLTETNQTIEALMFKLLDVLSKTFIGVTFRIGIGSNNDNILEAKDVYKESLIALRMASSKEPVITFQSLGIIGLLLQTNDDEAVSRIAEKTLGDLYKNRDDDLLKTFYIYLNNGGNLEQTAEELALSVSGLRYRISKINAILGTSVRSAEENFQLLLSLKVLVLNEKISIH